MALARDAEDGWRPGDTTAGGLSADAGGVGSAHHSQPLPPRERGKRLGQARLEPVLSVGTDVEQHPLAPAPSAGLPDPEQVARQVLDVLQSLPVLPGISQSLGRRILPILEAIDGSQGAAKPRPGFFHKPLERRRVLPDLARHRRHDGLSPAC
jgi:hypothetical protein